MRTMWTRGDIEAIQTATRIARGCYQRGLALGCENLSGSTLKGKAARYSGRYAESRQNFLGRCRAAGIKVSEIRAEHGARILVLEVA